MSLKCYLAEMIGTFAFIVIGAGSVCMEALTGGRVGLTGIALAHGLTIMAMVYTYGAVSGGHFNPAVTFGMFVTRRITTIRAIFYVISQLLGAALAGVCLKFVLSGHPGLMTAPPFLGACDLSGVSFQAGTLLEAIGTFFLVAAVYATTVDPRGSGATAPIAIGLTITLDILAFGPLTGGAVNPARAFGPWRPATGPTASSTGSAR